MSDNHWVLTSLLGCIVMLGYTFHAGRRLRAAKREGLSPEGLDYRWETVLVLGLAWCAALVWFATLLE